MPDQRAYLFIRKKQRRGRIRETHSIAPLLIRIREGWQVVWVSFCTPKKKMISTLRNYVKVVVGEPATGRR